MEEVPPRIIVREARKRGAKAATSEALTPRVDATPSVVADEGDFPVLEAFQDYLNKERQRVRKRLLGMGIAFAVALIVIATGGFFLVRTWMGTMDTRVQQVASTASADVQAADARIDAHDEQLRSNASAFDSLQAALTSEEQVRNSQHAQVSRVLSAYSNNVGALRQLVSQLEAEKQSLSTQLDDMSELLPELNAKIETLAQHGLRKPVEVRPGPTRSTQADLPSSGSGLVSMLILPQGHTQAIRWRQPIPE